VALSFGDLGLVRLLLRNASGYIAVKSFLRLSIHYLIIFGVPGIQVFLIPLVYSIIYFTRAFANQRSWLLLITLRPTSIIMKLLANHFRLYVIIKHLPVSKSFLEHRSLSPLAILVKPILDLESLLAHQPMALIQRHRRNALRPVRLLMIRFLRYRIFGIVRVQFEFTLKLKLGLRRH